MTTIIEIKIVKDEKARREHVRETSKRLMKGKVLKGKTTIVMIPEVFAKVFSPKRIFLIKTLEESEPLTISELARTLKRDFAVVHRDVKLLEQIGIVKLVKENRSVIPELVGAINIPITA